MKKVLFFIACLLCTAPVFAQNSSENGIMLISEEHNTSTLSQSQLKKCETLMKDAQWYIKKKEFGKAKNKLNQVLSINPNDAQAKVLLEQCNANSEQYGESADKKQTKFTFGATLGGDFFEKNFGILMGFTAKYGHYTELFNATAGLQFILQQSYHSRAYLTYTRSVILGGQLAVPVVAQFNLLKVTKNTRFYVGAGAEASIKLYCRNLKGQNFTGSWEHPLMKSFSVAGLIKTGITGRHFDAGIYYKHYFTDWVNDFYSSYQENDRIGATVSYYF